MACDCDCDACESCEQKQDFNYVSPARRFAKIWQKCEFCDALATEYHIDYYTCKEHLRIAVDNVHSRTMR